MKAKTYLTEEQKVTLIDDYMNNRFSGDQLALRYNISRKVVTQLIKTRCGTHRSRGLDLRKEGRAPRRIPPGEEQELKYSIANLLNEGLCATDIARALDISYKVAFRFTNEVICAKTVSNAEGDTVTVNESAKFNGAPVKDPEKCAEVFELKNAGLSRVAIADLLDVSHRTVSRMIEAHLKIHNNKADS